MIARITGTVIELDGEANTVLLEMGNIAYELMVPGYAVSNLSDHLRQEITLHCLEYYEGSAGGNSFVPRLLGFPAGQDKAFFQRFISVKGIGVRKALRALVQPPAQVANYIESGNADMLKTLPEIGKRTAEQIVAELKGKLGEFVLAGGPSEAPGKAALTTAQKEALEILLQLGERPGQAEELVGRAMKTLPDDCTTDTLVQAAYRLKAGSVD